MLILGYLFGRFDVWFGYFIILLLICYFLYFCMRLHFLFQYLVLVYLFSVVNFSALT